MASFTPVAQLLSDKPDVIHQNTQQQQDLPTNAVATQTITVEGQIVSYTITAGQPFPSVLNGFFSYATVVAQETSNNGLPSYSMTTGTVTGNLSMPTTSLSTTHSNNLTSPALISSSIPTAINATQSTNVANDIQQNCISAFLVFVTYFACIITGLI